MKKEDFVISKRFFTHTREWMCTDIGTRTIQAVSYHDYTEAKDDYPPYSVAEYSFDTYDMEGCWQVSDFENVDEKSFVFLCKNSHHIFCRDKNHLYRDDSCFKIKGSIDSFECLDHNYTKDDKAVYFGKYPIENIDSKSFKYLQEGLCRDKDFLYYGSKRCNEIDITQVRCLGNGFIVHKDKLMFCDNKDFTMKEIADIDLSSISVFNENYIRDDDFDYVKSEKGFEKQEHESSRLRKALSYRFRDFFDTLEQILFKADLMGIAYEDNANEYALERDALLLSIEKQTTTHSLKKSLEAIFCKNFSVASDKFSQETLENLSQTIWREYLLSK